MDGLDGMEEFILQCHAGLREVVVAEFDGVTDGDNASGLVEDLVAAVVH